MRRKVSAVIVALAMSGVVMQGQGRQVVVPGGAGAPFNLAVKGDGLIYVAGTLAQEGDIKAQTKKVLDDLTQILGKSGSSLANVASMQVYLKNAADFAAMNEVYRTYWPKDAPVRTTVVTNLVVASALVEMSAVAVPTGAERKVIHPAAWAPSTNPYSYGIKSGNTLFLAGLVARNGKDNSVVEGDMTLQSKTILDNAKEILAAAGMGLEHVVSSKVYITDGARFQDMNKVYTSYFTKEPPTRATVIAPLMGPQYAVEMTFTAVNAPKEIFTTPAADGTPGKPSAILSSAIKVGNRLYVSGILGNNAGNKGDMTAQTTEVMARIGRTLTAAGYGWGDLVDGVVYITDTAKFQEMNAGYRATLTKELPARATVQVGLVSPDGLVEIMFVAAK